MDKKTIIAPESKKNKRTDIEPSEEVPQETIRGNLAAHKRALQKYDTKQEFLYPVERITESKVVIRSVKFPGSDEEYPGIHQVFMRFVSAYYPNAKGGPLYVDEPKNDREVHRAYERHEVMKKLKLRHIIIEKDSTYEHLLEQLGEF